MVERNVARAMLGTRTMDGAGVALTRIFSNREAVAFDPFLLFDAFGSDDPHEYLAGFPRHPHRGIETVTYMLAGRVRHGDSIGNSGVIGPGDLQWMSAGSGIIHEEMPQRSPHGVHGLQLWVNLPRAEKMRDPAYRDASATSVQVISIPGGEVRPLAGSFQGVSSPISGIARDPAYFDLHLVPNAEVELETPSTQTAFVYLYSGSLAGTGGGGPYSAGTCILYREGDLIRLRAGTSGCGLVFARAEPLHEPIAWGGPIVMNTQEELELAFEELERGTFVKAKR